jgi:hypothetical protein
MIPEGPITDGVVALRRFRIDDAAPLYDAVRETLTDLKPWMSWAHDAYSRAEAEGFIKIMRACWEGQTLYALAVTDVKTCEFLGGVSLNHIHPVILFVMSAIGYGRRVTAKGLPDARRCSLRVLDLNTVGLSVPRLWSRWGVRKVCAWLKKLTHTTRGFCITAWWWGRRFMTRTCIQSFRRILSWMCGCKPLTNLLFSTS